MDRVIPNIIELEKAKSIVAAGMLAQPKYLELLTKSSPNILYINLIAPYTLLKERVIARNHFAGEKILDGCWELRDKLILPGPSVDNSGQSIDKVTNEIISLIKDHFSI